MSREIGLLLFWSRATIQRVRPFAPVAMSVALSPGGVSAVGSVDSSVAMQDLVRLQLQLQSRIASVRNASENDLSYHAIQAHNMAIKELFTELEEKLEVCLDAL